MVGPCVKIVRLAWQLGVYVFVQLLLLEVAVPLLSDRLPRAVRFAWEKGVYAYEVSYDPV